MEPTRATRFDLFIALVGSALLCGFLLIAGAVFLQGCSSMKAVGPDKSHYHKPKFQ